MRLSSERLQLLQFELALPHKLSNPLRCQGGDRHADKVLKVLHCLGHGGYRRATGGCCCLATGRRLGLLVLLISSVWVLCLVVALLVGAFVVQASAAHHFVHCLETTTAELLHEVGNLPSLDHELPTDHEFDETSPCVQNLTLPSQSAHHVRFAFLVHLEPQCSIVFDDVQGSVVLLYLSFCIEQDHVVCRDGRAKLEGLLQRVHLPLAFWCQLQFEVDCLLCVVFRVVFKQCLPILLPVPLRQILLEELTVILCPTLHRQLCDGGLGIPMSCDDSGDFTLSFLLVVLRDGALEASKPRQHLVHLLVLQETPQICNDVAGIVVRH
mmetsp:Transcript_29710/g.69087  ORF Transcript_29710/g.69087 Transcript_29710/m.69087 type:complete len:325 (-) Transcript_29710:1037-2011(-)